MKRITTALFAFIILGFANPAQALFEGRIGLGYHQVDPGELNASVAADVGSGLKVDKLVSLGVDIIIMPPLFPVGLGLRYEGQANKATSSGTTMTTGLGRLAVLVNKRLIDSVVFLGPIATFGLSSSASVEFKDVLSSQKWEADSVSSWSVGVEGGANLAGLVVGGELGYQSAVAKDFKYAGSTLKNVSGQSLKADFSGTYLKAFLGFGF